MAIPTPTVLHAAYTTGDASTYTVTPSPEPVIGSVLVLFSDTSHATLTAPTSTPTGKNLDWQLRGQQDHPTDVRRIFAHTAPVHSGFTTGTITLTMTGNTPSTGTGFALLQCLGVDLANPIVRAVSTNANSTGITLTLPQPLSVMNRWLVFCQHRAQENTVPRASPWSELDDKTGSAPVRGGDVQWLPGVVTSTGILETSASATWTTSSQASIIALELRARPDRQYWLFDTVITGTTHSLAADLVGEGEVTTAISHTATLAAALTGDGILGAEDDFERADGGLGVNWTDIFGPITIVSGQAIGPGGARRTETYPQDIASEIDVQLGADSTDVGTYVRGDSTGGGSLLGGWFSTGPTTGDYYLSADTLQTVSGAAPGTSVTLRLEATGTTARLLVNGTVIFTDDAGTAADSYITVFDNGPGSSIEAWRGPGPTLTITSGATTHNLAAALEGDGTLTAVAARTATLASALAGDGAFTVVASRTATLASALTGDGSFTAVAAHTATLASALAGDGALAAVFQGGGANHALAAALEADGTLTAVLTHTALLAAALAGDGALTVIIAEETVLGTVHLTATTAGCTLVAY